MPRLIAFGLLIYGLAIHSYIVLFKAEGDLNGFLIGLWVWSLSPYVVGAVLLRLRRNACAAAGWLVLPTMLDAVTYYDVFINPMHSTAELGLLFAPLWNLLLLRPLGGFAGWMFERKLGRAETASNKAP
jgi:hypothetical protein